MRELRFYEELNDFSRRQKKNVFRILRGSSTIKNAIEGIGVPYEASYSVNGDLWTFHICARGGLHFGYRTLNRSYLPASQARSRRCGARARCRVSCRLAKYLRMLASTRCIDAMTVTRKSRLAAVKIARLTGTRAADALGDNTGVLSRVKPREQ